METIVRTDLIFSFWILVWLLLYFMHIVTIAPKFLVLVGVVENIVLVGMLMMSKSSFYYIFRFFFINFWIKIFPLYFLWNIKITRKELYYSFIVFILYLIWLYINNETLYSIYYSCMYKTYIQVSKCDTIFAYAYDKCYNFLTNNI
jgi:hypothetical protein